MAICRICATELKEGLKFCPGCGKPAQAMDGPSVDMPSDNASAPQGNPSGGQFAYPPQGNPYGGQFVPGTPSPMGYGYPPQFDYATEEKAKRLVNSAFSKGLAATIISSIPIASIIAIALGSKAKKLVKKADNLANQYGFKLGGKRVAAKILGTVGKIVGIICTIIYSFYFVIGIIIGLSS